MIEIKLPHPEIRAVAKTSANIIIDDDLLNKYGRLFDEIDPQQSAEIRTAAFTLLRYVREMRLS